MVSSERSIKTMRGNEFLTPLEIDGIITSILNDPLLVDRIVRLVRERIPKNSRADKDWIKHVISYTVDNTFQSVDLATVLQESVKRIKSQRANSPPVPEPIFSQTEPTQVSVSTSRRFKKSSRTLKASGFVYDPLLAKKPAGVIERESEKQTPPRIQKSEHEVDSDFPDSPSSYHNPLFAQSGVIKFDNKTEAFSLRSVYDSGNVPEEVVHSDGDSNFDDTRDLEGVVNEVYLASSPNTLKNSSNASRIRDEGSQDKNLVMDFSEFTSAQISGGFDDDPMMSTLSASELMASRTSLENGGSTELEIIEDYDEAPVQLRLGSRDRKFERDFTPINNETDVLNVYKGIKVDNNFTQEALDNWEKTLDGNFHIDDDNEAEYEKEEFDQFDDDGKDTYQHDRENSGKKRRVVFLNPLKSVCYTREKYTRSEVAELFYTHEESLKFQSDYDYEYRKAEAVGQSWMDWMENRTDEDVARDEYERYEDTYDYIETQDNEDDEDDYWNNGKISNTFLASTGKQSLITISDDDQDDPYAF